MGERGDKHKNVGLDSLEEYVNRVINKLHDIKAIGVDVEFEKRPLFRRFISETSETLDNVKDCLLDSVMNQLSPKQVEFLIRDTTSLGMNKNLSMLCSSQMLADQPDEESFCMEWQGVFGRCFNIVSNIRIYCQKLCVGLVDSLTLAILLSDSSKVQSELELYGR